MRIICGCAMVMGIFTLVGCAAMWKLNEDEMKDFSTGELGCPASEITVSNYEGPMEGTSHTGTWTAECEGKRWFCSRTADGKGGGVVKCKEKS